MQQRTQLDNSLSFSAKKEREKALIALEKAKKIDRPVTFLPQGQSSEMRKLRMKVNSKKY